MSKKDDLAAKVARNLGKTNVNNEEVIIALMNAGQTTQQAESMAADSDFKSKLRKKLTEEAGN